MGFYFEDHQSMFAQADMRVPMTLEAIVRRYRGQNPAQPPTFRAYVNEGIVRGADYRYQADFNREFPTAPMGAFVYAWARIWSEGRTEIQFAVTVQCPTVLYRNQQRLYSSTVVEERDPTVRQTVRVSLEPGWNHLVMRFAKTKAGFGGVFGTWLGKQPYYFLMPTANRAGQEGWLFSEPQAKELSFVPGNGMSEEDTRIVWLPKSQWTRKELSHGQCRRIFGLIEGTVAEGWTRGAFLRPGEAEYDLSGYSLGPVRISIANRIVLASGKAGKFSVRVTVPFGWHDVRVQTECRGRDWGFDLVLRSPAGPVAFSSPCNLQGPALPWIYAGPLSWEQGPDLTRSPSLYTLVRGLKGETYWRLDAPSMWVRIYNENPLYGRWNYPLGVTLYGLLHSAHLIDSEETRSYIVGHMRYCGETFDYALWDRKQYGGATNVHHLLTSIDSLDDCGSFGSTLLEVMKEAEIPGAREIVDYVADYIANRQVRLPDGTFFRKNLMHTFHENTLWADDLYMSVPFLCRYFQLTGDVRYVDDAARQFVGFRKRLFIPEKRLMSHVYDFTRNLATGVAWGRGNGWVLFALTELLAVLPANHERKSELVAMFRELCSGVLAQQDARGMWHQVLDEHDSYPETSCTSMFACAFARGVRHGWFDDASPYLAAVYRAWEALNRTSIDRLGNVHGVCRGSEFSFTSEYYKRDLLWNLNDTHGIGIVLLAGVEVMRLTRHMQGEAESAAAMAAPGAVEKRGRASRAKKNRAAAR